VVFLDTSLPSEELGKLARNFNQPSLVLVSPASPTPETGESGVERRSIRFLTEVTLIPGPMSAVMECLPHPRCDLRFPEVIAARKNVIHFETAFGKLLEATRLEDGLIEIEIPSTRPIDIDEDEKINLKGHVDKSFGRDVKIKGINSGIGSYERCKSRNLKRLGPYFSDQALELLDIMTEIDDTHLQDSLITRLGMDIFTSSSCWTTRTYLG
jgi:hypothetical protein